MAVDWRTNGVTIDASASTAQHIASGLTSRLAPAIDRMAVAVERQPKAASGPSAISARTGVTPACPSCSSSGARLRLRDQHQAHQQPRVLPIGRLDAVVPVQLVGLERGFPVHLEEKRLIELAFGGERQDHGLAEHIRLSRAAAPPACPASAEFRRARRRSERIVRAGFPCRSRRNPTATASIVCAGCADRGDHRRIGRGRSGPAQALGQQICQLSEPPAEKIAYHDPEPSRLPSPGAAPPCYRAACARERPTGCRPRSVQKRFRMWLDQGICGAKRRDRLPGSPPFRGLVSARRTQRG